MKQLRALHITLLRDGAIYSCLKLVDPGLITSVYHAQLVRERRHRLCKNSELARLLVAAVVAYHYNLLHTRGELLVGLILKHGVVSDRATWEAPPQRYQVLEDHFAKV